jgi:DNA polymerase-3 subunit beta
VLRAGTGEEARAHESLECVLEGDDIEIAFNPDYLLAGLAAVDSATTRMRFTVSQKPAVLVGVADGVVRPDYRYLLMPIRLAAGSSGG